MNYRKNKRFESLFQRLEYVFILLFFIVSFLHYSSLTCGRSVISFFQWPTVFLGAILVFYRFLHFRRYFFHPTVFLLLAFLGSYLLSSLCFFSYGYYENFRGFVFLAFQVLLLFSFDSLENPSRLSEKNAWVALLYIGGTFLLSLISIGMLFAHSSIILPQEAGPTVVIGFAWGRLFGAYWDPNIASAMAVISLLLSFYFFFYSDFRKKYFRCFLVFNALVQLLYLSFSDSRTGRVTLVFGVTLLSAFWLFRYWTKRYATALFRGIAIALSLTLIVLCVTLAAPFVVKSTAVGVEALFLKEGETSFFDDGGRKNDISTDLSNRRFDIWSAALDVGNESPWIGVSHFNLIAFVRDRIPDSYLICNDHMIFDTMHNVVVDIFASQGILGLSVFLSTVVFALYRIVKYRKCCISKENFHRNSTWFSILGVVFLASMFMTEIVYVISPLTLIFWVAFGQIIRDTKK